MSAIVLNSVFFAKISLNGRPKRAAQAGYIYHVLNRANAWMTIFATEDDYAAFERILSEAVERFEKRLLCYCVISNHWYLVVYPREDGLLSGFTGWLTLPHTQHWHAHSKSSGSGHVYRGSFKSFPVQGDEHFDTVGRYVERIALTANLVKHVEDWRWYFSLMENRGPTNHVTVSGNTRSINGYRKICL